MALRLTPNLFLGFMHQTNSPLDKASGNTASLSLITDPRTRVLRLGLYQKESSGTSTERQKNKSNKKTYLVTKISPPFAIKERLKKIEAEKENLGV